MPFWGVEAVGLQTEPRLSPINRIIYHSSILLSTTYTLIWPIQRLLINLSLKPLRPTLRHKTWFRLIPHFRKYNAAPIIVFEHQGRAVTAIVLRLRLFRHDLTLENLRFLSIVLIFKSLRLVLQLFVVVVLNLLVLFMINKSVTISRLPLTIVHSIFRDIMARVARTAMIIATAGDVWRILDAFYVLVFLDGGAILAVIGQKDLPPNMTPIFDRMLVFREPQCLCKRLVKTQLIFILLIHLIGTLLTQLCILLIIINRCFLRQLPYFISSQISEFLLRIYAVEAFVFWNFVRHEHGSCFSKVKALLRKLQRLLLLMIHPKRMRFQQIIIIFETVRVVFLLQWTFLLQLLLLELFVCVSTLCLIHRLRCILHIVVIFSQIMLPIRCHGSTCLVRHVAAPTFNSSNYHILCILLLLRRFRWSICRLEPILWIKYGFRLVLNIWNRMLWLWI